jgi:hypothetical protein
MKKIKCDSEAGAKVDIPESEFLAATLRPLGEFIRDTLALSEPSCHFLLWIYPLLKDGKEWTPAELLAELTKHAQIGQVIKNRSALLYHLDALVKQGILKKAESDRSRYALSDSPPPELQFLNRILFNGDLRDILEDHLVYIYILLCCIARLIKGNFPAEEPRQIFTMTATLFRIAMELTITDLETRGVLEQQCADCFYPYHHIEWEAASPTEKAHVAQLLAEIRGESVEAPQDESTDIPSSDPAVESSGDSAPLYEQVRQFIGRESVGVAKTEIFAHFQSLGYSEGMINDSILELTNQGETRINLGRYILNT